MSQNKEKSKPEAKEQKVKIQKEDVLHDILTYDPNNIFFGTPQVFKIEKKKVTYHLIPIFTKNPETTVEEEGPDGQMIKRVIPATVGSLYLQTPKYFSFGVQEIGDLDNKDKEKDKDEKKVTGHSLSLSLWDQGGIPTDEQKFVTDKIQAILDRF